MMTMVMMMMMYHVVHDGWLVMMMMMVMYVIETMITMERTMEPWLLSLAKANYLPVLCSRSSFGLVVTSIHTKSE